MATTTIANPNIGTLGQDGFTYKIVEAIPSIPENFQTFLDSYWFNSLVSFMWAFFVIIVLGIAYILYKHISLQHAEKKRYYDNFDQIVQEGTPLVGKRHNAWREVVEHLKSDNESDWKVAILEADSILSELLEDLKYDGDNLGERLKSVPKGDMQSIDNAWEAHKMRNRIAHEGATMALTKKELGDTLANFEKVFREFNYI